MEKDLDKDIEIVKEKIKALNLHILNYKKSECETSFYQTLVKERNALVNVLSELKELRKYDIRKIELKNGGIEKAPSFTKREIELMNLGIALYCNN